MKNPFKKQVPPPPKPPEDKGSFPDFTKKEIFTQGEMIKALLDKYMRGDKINFDCLKIKIEKIKRIYTVGGGSDYACALFAAYNFEVMLDIASFAVSKSEFLYSNPILDKGTLVVLVGKSRAVEERVMKAGARLIKIAQAGGDRQTVCTGCKTLGAFDTARFTLNLTALAMLALYFGEKGQVITELYVRLAARGIKALPDKIRRVLAGEFIINETCKSLDCGGIFFTGTNVDYAVAVYAASLFADITGGDVSAVPLGELKRSQKARGSAVALASNADFYSLLDGVSCRLKIAPGGAGSGESTILYDGTIPLLNPILSAVEVQMLAYSYQILNSAKRQSRGKTEQ